jgi:hypothetical protein
VKKRPQEYKCNTETSGLVDDQWARNDNEFP